MGAPFYKSGDWIFGFMALRDDGGHLYGFSQLLTVAGGGAAVPEPGTVVLSLMGLAAGAVLRRRRRRGTE